jgi:hypothetical protein
MNVKSSFEILRDFTWLTEMVAVRGELDELPFASLSWLTVHAKPVKAAYSNKVRS